MTRDGRTAILEAELQTAELLTETLDNQREALVERDVDRLNEVTAALEDQIAHFGTLVEARKTELEGGPSPREAEAELLRQIRGAERRLLHLAEINQDLIADRLACVSGLLSTLGLTDTGVYGPQRQHQRVRRSA